jgi:coatomer subunit beta
MPRSEHVWTTVIRMSSKRNAFLMLLHADQELALNYMASCLDQVNSFGDILQLVIVELTYKVSKS